jgi:hypothetical protein
MVAYKSFLLFVPVCGSRMVAYKSFLLFVPVCGFANNLFSFLISTEQDRTILNVFADSCGVLSIFRMEEFGFLRNDW